MTLPHGHESERRPPGTTVYRPQLGFWLAYSFLMAISGFFVFVGFYEDRTPRDRVVVIVAAAGVALLLVDLGVAQVRLDHQSVRIRGFFANDEFTYHEVAGPPEAVAPNSLAKPILRLRLSNGRIVKFPVWLGARERREIVGKIEAHRKGHVI